MKNQMIQEAAEVWCPNYPRRCAGISVEDWKQVRVQCQDELFHNLDQVEGEFPCYVSTYAFPHGHPTNDPDNVPRIDTLMIDFDFEFDKEQFNREEWEQRLSELLTRIRKVAQSLVKNDLAKYWRASLSGFKGVHLYLDFPAIDEGLGTPAQYRNGMDSFTNEVVDGLKAETGIFDLEDYIDVSSGWDLSRLTRLPNTIHEKATEAFGEERYCVPVSIRELQHVNVQTYVALSRSQRRVPEEGTRYPNLRTKKKVEQSVLTSPEEEATTYTASIKDKALFKDYKKRVVNEKVELEDVEFLLKRKPCVLQFYKNPRKFDHGNASHIMEMQSILAMKSIGTPIEVMKEFFKFHPTKDVHPKYDEPKTEKRIREVLSRDYQEFKCTSVVEDANQFCQKQNCKIYRDDNRLQQIH